MKRTLVITALLASCVLCRPVLADANLVDSTPNITVSGQCLKSVIPDRGRVVANAVFVDPADAKAASNQAVQAYQKALARVKELGLEDGQYQTVNYNLSEKYEYSNNANVFKGYQASIGLSVSTSDIKRLGEVIAAATDADFKNINELTQFISQQKLASVQAECYQEAVLDAKQKATRMAETLDVKLGRPLIVNSAVADQTPVQNLTKVRSMAAMDVAESVASPSIESQAEDLQMSVSVTFALD